MGFSLATESIKPRNVIGSNEFQSLIGIKRSTVQGLMDCLIASILPVENIIKFTHSWGLR